jgi:pimeloyl-ACP methyl ester carboxylesterase
VKILLDDPDMDAQLSRTLIAIAPEAGDIGEALATASRTTAGDYDSWFTEWSATAEVARALAEEALKRGHEVTARKAYLRASEYWRQSFFSIRHANDDNPRPTVLAPRGFDSTAEAGYCATGYMALSRGYNFFVFEGPGQGGMLFEHRMPFRPDFEVPFAAAFEWLNAQDGVDRETVAVIGRSFGGYLGSRAAAFEPRVAALVADPGQYDFASRVGLFSKGLGAKGLGSGTPEDFLARLTASDPDLDAQLQGAVDGPRSLEWYGSRMAAMGATRVGDFIRKQLTFTLEDVAADIRCPTLLTEGEAPTAAK